MKVFWILKPAARAKLMQFQHKLYGTQLDMASQTPPWEHIQAVPEIPVHTEMTEQEMGEFMAQPPSGPERVE
jgi:hypothetical protein